MAFKEDVLTVGEDVRKTFTSIRAASPNLLKNLVPISEASFSEIESDRGSKSRPGKSR